MRDIGMPNELYVSFSHLQNGNTPLHLACQNNEVDTVEILINKGVDLNCLNLVGKPQIALIIFNNYYVLNDKKNKVV